jgi:hypothetical protein
MSAHSSGNFDEFIRLFQQIPQVLPSSYRLSKHIHQTELLLAACLIGEHRPHRVHLEFENARVISLQFENAQVVSL